MEFERRNGASGLQWETISLKKCDIIERKVCLHAYNKRWQVQRMQWQRVPCSKFQFKKLSLIFCCGAELRPHHSLWDHSPRRASHVHTHHWKGQIGNLSLYGLHTCSLYVLSTFSIYGLYVVFTYRIFLLDVCPTCSLYMVYIWSIYTLSMLYICPI